MSEQQCPHAGLVSKTENGVIRWHCASCLRGFSPSGDTKVEQDLVLARERVRLLEDGVRKSIKECGACGGKGYDVGDDGEGEVSKEPCNACWDLRELIQDHTDYPLEATASRVVPFVKCTKMEFCTMADGHNGDCDDIPF